LRYRRLPPPNPQKKRSHRPSSSTSPAATPEPLGKMVLVKDRDSGRQLVNQIPVCWADRREKPLFPPAGIVSGLNRYPGPICQVWACDGPAARRRTRQTACWHNRIRTIRLRMELIPGARQGALSACGFKPFAFSSTCVHNFACSGLVI
jgi:hypothetical protein